jgi:hypothetical protein
MIEKATSMRGSCLCRAVAYAVSGQPGPMWHCHCVICRKLSGAAFATHIAALAADFSWLRGQEVHHPLCTVFCLYTVLLWPMWRGGAVCNG